MEKEKSIKSDKLGLINSTKLFFRDLFVGATRIKRADFWWGYLGTTIITAIALGLLTWIMTILPVMDYYWSAVDGVAMAIVAGYYLIAIFNAAIRRLHDANFRAWWMLMLIIPVLGYIGIVILMCLSERDEGNRYVFLVEDLES